MQSQVTASLLFLSVLFGNTNITLADEAAWTRHTIDATSRGADGVRVRDVNGDSLPDFTTGWEEGGVIRVYLHPGKQNITKPWPRATVGKVKSPEDAIFVDLDKDGAVDVVSSCEGRNRTMYVHWAPSNSKKYLDETAWKTEALPVTKNLQSWMFALPMQIDGQHGPDLIVSSKGKDASIGWLQSPPNPRDLNQWKYRKLYDAGWIMSLLSHDMDGDGDVDVLVSDRKGKKSGILWLENPGTSPSRNWPEHRIAAVGREVMFLDCVDLDGDNQEEVLAALKPADVIIAKRDDKQGWTSEIVKLNAKKIGTAKSVRGGDFDLDGKIDLVFSC